MNTSALKTFAPAVRRHLIEAVTRKLDFVLTAQTPDYLTTFAPQVAALRRLAGTDRPGLIERVAYTWFNRLAALRFMDARGWHPFRARVLTPASAVETQPELLKLTRAGALPEELKSHTDPARLNDLLDGRIPSSDAQGEVYRHLVLAACRFYNTLLPDIFEKIADETELLLPDDLLTEHAVVHGFRTEISDEDCGDGQRANVEILGWLYQFYISERKDQVMARKSAVPTEDIPAVTQLFTPHWIVRYLVENSLGRLWLDSRPNSRLRDHMPYFIESAPGETGTTKPTSSGSSSQPPDLFTALESQSPTQDLSSLRVSKPEEIKLVDPACGSGHMLTYAFDLLTLIYEEEGYAPTEIPALILRHNLHGLEICPRAAQLAELALVFKAREKSRRFFQSEHLVRPHIIELRDVRFAENELRDYIHALGLGDLFNQPMLRLLHQFEEAKNFGSLIQPCLDERIIANARRAIEAKDLGGQLFLRDTHLKVLRVLEQAEALTQRYHVVVANPPYMGGKAMNEALKAFGKENYENGRADLMTMFLERSFTISKKGAMLAFITLDSWMFLSSFEELRGELIRIGRVSSLIHIGWNCFPHGHLYNRGVGFVFCNAPGGGKGTFVNLSNVPATVEKEPLLLQRKNTGECVYVIDPHSFRALPGYPFAYWLSQTMRDIFKRSRPLKEVGDTRQGMATSDNNRFLRQWSEVAMQNIGFGLADREAAKKSGLKWIPYNKGGEYRKWFGNQYYVVNWADDGKELLDYAASLYGSPTRTIKSISEYFKSCISWSKVTSSDFAVRYYPTGFIFDVAGCCIFFTDPIKQTLYLGFVNSVVAKEILKSTSPTLNFETGHIAALPILSLPDDLEGAAISNINLAITNTKRDWDNFETSWDFRDQPLLRPGLKGATLEASWRNWEAQSTAAIRRMQELETENNRLFIAAYGLDGELQPEVPEAQITLARAEARRDMAAFLSYAVGCMMGRYSLEAGGLILADAGASVSDYWKKVQSSAGILPASAGGEAGGTPALRFAPDADGILPILDGEWFEDDIVARTRDFLRATFGEATLRENLRFLEDSLGKDLRKYFLTDFYKDHLQTYKKRPIYWMVQSPKKGFSVLFYLHRYTRDTINLVLNRYLREYQVKLRNRLESITLLKDIAPTAREKTEARKEADKLTKTLLECEEWERQTLLPLAQARIELDLDAGVKVNYLKLGEALAPIAGLAKEEET